MHISISRIPSIRITQLVQFDISIQPQLLPNEKVGDKLTRKKPRRKNSVENRAKPQGTLLTDR